MRKRCPEHGLFEALVYAEAQAYTSASRFNKPGMMPIQYTTAIEHGCPHDCGLCLDHQQLACVGIIEVNSACNMDRLIRIADFEEYILRSGVPVVVEFWAQWCGPGHMIAPIPEEIANQYAGKVIVAKVNTDDNPE